VLSHGHSDHTGGLSQFMKQRERRGAEEKPVLVAHPLAMREKRLKRRAIGIAFGEAELARHFRMSLSEKPQWLSEDLVFLGEIERRNDFENLKPLGRYRDGEAFVDDYLRDDSALVHKSAEGLVIVTGCSHSGICNIVEQARRTTGVERVRAVIGGFHLHAKNEELVARTCERIAGFGIERTYACHCTDLKSKIALSRACQIEEAGVGLELEF
jgi:7,8-dihydropterin-6-yl-methyl-4-(beta-D-ribofuranosyl)aminobenzene 5'-phosphate synthase